MKFCYHALQLGGRLAWLGKYSSMALIPMLVGREAMLADSNVQCSGGRGKISGARGRSHRSFK